MARFDIPGIDNLDDIIKAFKARGTWLNRFDAIIDAIERMKDYPDDAVRKNVLEALTSALRAHLKKEELAKDNDTS